jgi:hypothetical protein
MSGRHQIFVYECKNCGETRETMDTKDYLEDKMKEYPDIHACCEKPELEMKDQYFR